MVSINIEKKDLWLLASMFVFIAGVGIVIAYRSGAAPSVFGHSGEELEVNISGTIKTLQQAIDNEDFGGSGYTCVVYCTHFCSSGYAEEVTLMQSNIDISGSYIAGTYSICPPSWCNDRVRCIAN